MSVRNGKAVSYQVHISEEQRKIIVEALRQSGLDDGFMLGELENLPELELEVPGAVYGFCI